MYRRFAILAVVVLLCGGPPAIGDIVTGLQVHYAFDNPLQPAADTSGNARDGAVSGAELVIDPVRLLAMSFDSSDSVSGPLSGAGISSAGVTVALWAYSTTAITGNDGLFVANAGVANNKTIAGWVNASNQIWGRIRVDGDKSLPADNDAVLPSGTWTHLAFRGDGSKYEVIINGTPTGNSVAYSGSLNETITDLLVGRQGSESWQGLIDDFRIYSRALSDTDIADLVALPAVWKYSPNAAFDINGTEGASHTQAGFTPVDQNGPTSATSLLTTLTISGSLNESRDRATGGALTGSEPLYDLLRDFVFENDGQPVELEISGLMPDTQYFLTVYSYDSNGNNGTKSEWYQDAISGTPLYTHTLVQADPTSASFVLPLFSDSAGTITLFAQPPGGSGIVILNGLEIDIVPEPSAIAMFIGMAGAGLLCLWRRRRTAR